MNEHSWKTKEEETQREIIRQEIEKDQTTELKFQSLVTSTSRQYCFQCKASRVQKMSLL